MVRKIFFLPQDLLFIALCLILFILKNAKTILLFSASLNEKYSDILVLGWRRIKLETGFGCTTSWRITQLSFKKLLRVNIDFLSSSVDLSMLLDIFLNLLQLDWISLYRNKDGDLSTKYLFPKLSIKYDWRWRSTYQEKSR